MADIKNEVTNVRFDSNKIQSPVKGILQYKKAEGNSMLVMNNINANL